MEKAVKHCLGCAVLPGQPHHENCDHACCPDCGEQLFWHECPEWPEGAEGPDRPALWHGIDPRAEVARTLDWWTLASGVDGPVENYTRVSYAVHLGQVTWDPQAQRYVIGKVDEIALDRALAGSYPTR